MEYVARALGFKPQRDEGITNEQRSMLEAAQLYGLDATRLIVERTEEDYNNISKAEFCAMSSAAVLTMAAVFGTMYKDMINKEARRDILKKLAASINELAG